MKKVRSEIEFKKTNKKQQKKAFTLIELLAVIIILGVLMIIAIPSVTRYIDESRKSGYISTAKDLAGGARNLIHSGDLDFNDTDTTYYIEGKCIATDNAYKSPYGEFDDKRAYVVITATDDGHEYYWVSVDSTGTGVNSIKKVDKLEVEDIVSGIDTGEIDTNIGIDKRKNIVVVGGDNCTKSEPKPATRKMNSNTGKVTNPCPSVTETIYWALQNPNSDNSYQKLVISDSPVTGGLSGNFPGNTVFSSFAEVPWITSSNIDTYITEVEIIGTVAPTSIAYWFMRLGFIPQEFNMDLNNLEVCNVTNMSYAFSNAGYVSQSFTLDISDWNTSKVTNMSHMFDNTAGLSTSINFDLSNFDTSSVTDFSYMFFNYAADANVVNLDLKNWDTSSSIDMKFMFYGIGYNSSSTINIKLDNWILGNDSSYMFYSLGNQGTALNLSLTGVNTSKVTNMNSMFCNIMVGGNLSLDLSNWNVSNVTDMESMFYGFGANASNVMLNLSNWNTRNVTNMAYMFTGCGYSTQTFSLNLGGFNTSNVANMSEMFNYAGYNATNYGIIIPRTNGNETDNTVSRMYGKTASIYATPLNNKQFTLAS